MSCWGQEGAHSSIPFPVPPPDPGVLPFPLAGDHCGDGRPVFLLAAGGEALLEAGEGAEQLMCC